MTDAAVAGTSRHATTRLQRRAGLGSGAKVAPSICISTRPLASLRPRSADRPPSADVPVRRSQTCAGVPEACQASWRTPESITGGASWVGARRRAVPSPRRRRARGRHPDQLPQRDRRRWRSRTAAAPPRRNGSRRRRCAHKGCRRSARRSAAMARRCRRFVGDCRREMDGPVGIGLASALERDPLAIAHRAHATRRADGKRCREGDIGECVGPLVDQAQQHAEMGEAVGIGQQRIVRRQRAFGRRCAGQGKALALEGIGRQDDPRTCGRCDRWRRRVRRFGAGQLGRVSAPRSTTPAARVRPRRCGTRRRSRGRW